jgi:hypothetical protein
MADLFACLLDLSLVEEAYLNRISMLERDKLARRSFSRVKSLVH